MASSGVRDANDESVWSVFFDAGANLAHNLQIDAKEIIAAHAGAFAERRPSR